MTEHIYKDVEEYTQSESFLNLKREIVTASVGNIPPEEVFDLSTINFSERTEYPITWGIKKLDENIGGQPRGKYTMLYGGPSSGKTTYTIQLAVANSKAGNKVGYLSLEMPKKDFIMQNMRTRAGLKNKTVGLAQAPTQHQQDIMKKFIQDISLVEIKSYQRQPTFKEFKSIMDGLVLESYDLIIIDNLGMIGRGDNIDELSLYGMVSAYIKEYVDRTGTGVFLLHHTNKGSESSMGRRGFSAFRGNGKIADDCDYVIQLEREYKEGGGTESRIKVEKDRIWGNNGYILSLEFINGEFNGLDF